MVQVERANAGVPTDLGGEMGVPATSHDRTHTRNQPEGNTVDIRGHGEVRGVGDDSGRGSSGGAANYTSSES